MSLAEDREELAELGRAYRQQFYGGPLERAAIAESLKGCPRPEPFIDGRIWYDFRLKAWCGEYRGDVKVAENAWYAFLWVLCKREGV